MEPCVFECKTCFEQFDSLDRRPLSLNCGHTFCKFCVGHFVSATNRGYFFGRSTSHILCPTCRKVTDKSIGELTVIFALIPLNENATASSARESAGIKCKDHGCSVDYFCTECREMVCRRCVKISHVQHHTELIDDILNMEPNVAACVGELKNRIAANVQDLSRLMLVPIEISTIIGKLLNYDIGIEEWKNHVWAQKKQAEQTLKEWKDARQKSAKEKHELLKKLCIQWNGVELSTRAISELASLTEKLRRLHNRAVRMQELMQGCEDPSKQEESQGGDESEEEDSKIRDEIKLLSTDAQWRIEDEDDYLIAIYSVLSGNTTKYFKVGTFPTNFVAKLPDVLNFLGSACTDRIIIKPLNTYWASSMMTVPGHFQAFFEKFGHKVCEFYGSSQDAAALCRINPNINRIGVRLASMDDIRQCLDLPKFPTSVCCIGGLPPVAGAHMMLRDWQPTEWHFPDARAGSVHWVMFLMAPVM